MSFPIRALVLAVALAPCFGCGDSSKGIVKGEVTYQAKPLATGIVSFVPVDGSTATASADIKDGKFTAEVPVGEMSVRFSAPKIMGKTKMYDTPDAQEIEVLGELFPPEHNVRSTHVLKVVPGEQPAKFDLK